MVDGIEGQADMVGEMVLMDIVCIDEQADDEVGVFIEGPHQTCFEERLHS